MSALKQLDFEAYRRDQLMRNTETGLHAARVGDPGGFELVCERIEVLAADGFPFTSDNVPNVGSNAKGSAFRHMARLGVIVPEGFTTSQSPTSHGHVIRIWRGSS